ncbi:MAG: hypothetical protein B7Y42_05870 [Polaromonas sp. 28-63-22]|nr:MAG: hypothetical protein B7Y42_05870 [Polaromonas sp. 28-63-22]
MRIRFLSIPIRLWGRSLPSSRPADALDDLPGAAQSHLTCFMATASRGSLVSDAMGRIGARQLELHYFSARALKIALVLLWTHHINRRWSFT